MCAYCVVSDFRYLFIRAQKANCLASFSRNIARVNSPDSMPHISNESFTSRAFGATTFSRLVCPGRLNLDLLFYFRRNVKLNSYSLDDVAKRILETGKAPISYHQMWDAWETRNAKVLGDVGIYCVRDTELVQLVSLFS